MEFDSELKEKGARFPQSPEILAQNGQFASAPFIIGDQQDEGSLFFLVQSNISTTDDAVQYLSTAYFHDATVEQVQALVGTYPNAISRLSLQHRRSQRTLPPVQMHRLHPRRSSLHLHPTHVPQYCLFSAPLCSIMALPGILRNSCSRNIPCI